MIEASRRFWIEVMLEGSLSEPAVTEIGQSEKIFLYTTNRKNNIHTRSAEKMLRKISKAGTASLRQNLLRYVMIKAGLGLLQNVVRYGNIK